MTCCSHYGCLVGSENREADAAALAPTQWRCRDSNAGTEPAPFVGLPVRRIHPSPSLTTTNHPYCPLGNFVAFSQYS